MVFGIFLIRVYLESYSGSSSEPAGFRKHVTEAGEGPLELREKAKIKAWRERGAGKERGRHARAHGKGEGKVPECSQEAKCHQTCILKSVANSI